MDSKTGTRFIALTLFAALALPLQLAAQTSSIHPHQYHHYQLVDPGTFGGPWSGLQTPFFPRSGVLSNQGTLAGWANTSASDAPFCGFGDCYAGDGFAFQNGVTTDLGRISGGYDSQVNWISGNGLMAGLGDNGVLDPVAGFPIPQLHGFLWDHGNRIDLGTLPEGGYLVFPNAVNNRGEVVGSAQNTVPDANTMFNPGYGTQSRAFYWKNGAMKDLGTLASGTDAVAALINERGQVIGWSYTDSTPSPICASLWNFGFALTTGSFTWDQKNGMRDIGGLGGSCTIATDLNNRGQIVGISAVTGDLVLHPFVWDAATGMTDLGAPAGDSSIFALTINERGVVAGSTCGVNLPADCHSLVWRKTGGKWKKTDLGLGNVTTSINASGQVVGYGNINYLWEAGGTEVDLYALLPGNSSFAMNEVNQINDRGEIAAQGWDANGNHRAVLLIPCDEAHPSVEGCDYDWIDAATVAAHVSRDPVQHPAALTPGARVPGMLNGFHFPGKHPVPSPASAPKASSTLAATTAAGDWLSDTRLNDDQLIPESGTPPLYCELSNGTLDGTCVQSTGPLTCHVTFTGCPLGHPASANGFITCGNGGREAPVSKTKCFSLPGFDVSTTGLTPTMVKAGGSASSTLTVSDYGGFSGSVSYSCSVQATQTTLLPMCSFSPSSVTAGTPATLTVSTTAPTGALRTGTGSSLFYAFFLPLGGLFAMVLRFGPQQNKQRQFTAALACMLFSVVALQTACGGKPLTPGTPAGSYTITVKGSDSSGTVVSAVTFPPLTVQ